MKSNECLQKLNLMKIEELLNYRRHAPSYCKIDCELKISHSEAQRGHVIWKRRLLQMTFMQAGTWMSI